MKTNKSSKLQDPNSRETSNSKLQFGVWRLVFLWSLMFGVWCLPASGQVINVLVAPLDLVGERLTNESISLSPAWSGGRVYGTNIYPNRTKTLNTGAAGGFVIFSNVLFGPYTLNFSDTQLGLEVPTNLSGTINAAQLITNPVVIFPLNEFFPASQTGGGTSGVSFLQGTNSDFVGVLGDTGFVPTNWDAAGAAAAATNPIPSWITAATNPILAWISAATNPIPNWISASSQNSTNPIPQWISSAQAPEVLTNDTRAVALTNVANNFWGFFVGNGANLNSLNAAAISSGTVPVARLPVATPGSQGMVQPDNSTITINNGVISASGGAAAQTLTPFYWIVGIATIGSGTTDFLYPMGYQSAYFTSGFSRCEIPVPQNWGPGPITFTNVSFGLNCASGVSLGAGTNIFLYYATNAPGASASVVAGGGWAAEIVGGSAQQYITNNPTFSFPLYTNILFYGFLSNSAGATAANMETWGAYNILHN